MYEELVTDIRYCVSGDKPCGECKHIEELCCDTTLLEKAADAIEQLSNAGSAYGRGWTLGYDAGREESKPHWIPVTERLPERNTWVLAYCKYKGHVIDYVDINGLWSYGNVTHWMPLPEPPKEDAK